MSSLDVSVDMISVAKSKLSSIHLLSNATEGAAVHGRFAEEEGDDEDGNSIEGFEFANRSQVLFHCRLFELDELTLPLSPRDVET